jgi:hypothetical protein
VLMLSHGQQPDLFPDLEDMPIALRSDGWLMDGIG